MRMILSLRRPLHVCQSYSGRSADGRPLVFHLRDPSFPSQHQTRLDLSNSTTELQGPLQSHSKEVHGPKHITPVRLQRLENIPPCIPLMCCYGFRQLLSCLKVFYLGSFCGEIFDMISVSDLFFVFCLQLTGRLLNHLHKRA